MNSSKKITLILNSEQFWNKIYNTFINKGGVYKVIAFDGTRPIEIPRVLKNDCDGVLYIGKADSFLDRVITLKKSTDPKYKSSNHEFGVRYKTINGIKEKFPYETLKVELLGSTKPIDLEKDELKKYIKTYGELPPLNRNE